MTKGRKPPSPTADNGRGANGRFGPANQFGKGNPHAQRVQLLRGALMESVSPADIRQIIKRLVKAARAGDLAAARELLDRTIGRAANVLQIDSAILTEDQLNAELERTLDELGRRRQATAAGTRERRA